MQQVLNVKRTRRLPSLGQLIHLPRFLSPRERKIAFGAITVTLLTALALGGQFVARRVQQSPATGGEYVEGIIGYPHFINPLYAYANEVDAALTRLAFAGLMRQDPNEGLVPDLAESYTISSDERTYTFVLREGVLWQDGQPVTSEDVLFTITAMQNPDYGSPLQSTLAGIVVEAPDAKTVVFTIPEPFAPFLSTLTIGILPSHVWKNVPASNAQLTQLNLKPIGNGPYLFDKLIKDSKGNLRSMTFVRNPEYYRGAPHLSKLTFKFFASSVELIDGLRNHTVGGTAMLTAEELKNLSNDKAFTVHQAMTRQYVGAFFNLKSTSPIASAEVRNALVTATDRELILGALSPHTGKIMSGAFFEGIPGFDALRTQAPVDLAAAATTLEKAGWLVPDEGGVRTKDGKSLAFTITTLDIPEFITVARTLSLEWQALGVQATVVEVDSTAFENTVLKNRTYDILIAGEQYGIFPDPYPFWHSSQGNYPGLNVSQLVSKTADAAISTIRSTADANARAEAFTELASVLESTPTTIFLYQSILPIVLSSDLKAVNLPLTTTPGDRFADVHEWYLKTKPVFKKPEQPPNQN